MSPARLKKVYDNGDIEYVQGPHNETPPALPYVKLAESVARSVWISAG